MEVSQNMVLGGSHCINPSNSQGSQGSSNKFEMKKREMVTALSVRDKIEVRDTD